MSLVKTPQSVSNVKGVEELQRFVSQAVEAITSEVNGRLSIDKNLAVSLVSVVFTTTSSPQSVDHGLKRLPIGYFITKKSAAMDVFGGLEDATTLKANMQASALGTATILFF